MFAVPAVSLYQWLGDEDEEYEGLCFRTPAEVFFLA